MNRIILVIAVLICLVSCTEKRYGFRKTIKVKETEQVFAKQKTKQTKANHEAEAEGISQTQTVSEREQTATLFQENTSPKEVLSASSQINDPILLTESQWKQSVPEPPKDLKPVEKKAPAGDRSGLAVAGFILGVVGLLVFGLICGILAIIFGVLGLKSSRKGFAIASIILGFIDIIGVIIFINSL